MSTQEDGARTKDAEALCLEDALQGGEVDDKELTHDGGQDSVAEGPVAAQTHLMHHTGLWGDCRGQSHNCLCIILLFTTVSYRDLRACSGASDTNL